MIPLDQLCPGVSPTGDSLVYFVKSRTRKGMKHRVDLTAWSGFGECGCEHFLTKVAPALRAGIMPRQEIECYHLGRARFRLALELAQGIILAREKEAHANQTKNHHKPSQYQNEDCPY